MAPSYANLFLGYFEANAFTIEYSSTDVTLLPSLFVSSERTRCFAKQMAECRFRDPKTSEEEENCVDSAIPR